MRLWKAYSMQIVFDNSSLRGLDLYLMPQSAWLVMTGFSDHRQAAVAATHFIGNVRNLQDDMTVAVTGKRTLVDGQPAIMLTDVNAAGLGEQTVVVPVGKL